MICQKTSKRSSVAQCRKTGRAELVHRPGKILTKRLPCRNRAARFLSYCVCTAALHFFRAYIPNADVLVHPRRYHVVPPSASLVCKLQKPWRYCKSNACLLGWESVLGCAWLVPGRSWKAVHRSRHPKAYYSLLDMLMGPWPSLHCGPPLLGVRGPGALGGA